MSNAAIVQGHANGVAGAMMRPAEGRDVDASIIERVIAAGDLSRLQPQDRVAYYVAVCRSVGLNPLTKPFDYLQLNGKLTLYSTKNCTDQLRQIHGVSVGSLRRETHEGVHIVTAPVRTKDGREDEDIGAVSIKGLQGEALANALMKATTKAKRRATLSICGLSFVDESELETIPDARRVTVDQDGVILDGPGVVKPRAPAPQVDAGLFQSLCDAVDDANAPALLNVLARNAQKAHRAGALSDTQLETIARAVKAKRAQLTPPKAPEPAASDPGPMPESSKEVSR
jgi:hypothetical protein